MGNERGVMRQDRNETEIQPTTTLLENSTVVRHSVRDGQICGRKGLPNNILRNHLHLSSIVLTGLGNVQLMHSVIGELVARALLT